MNKNNFPSLTLHIKTVRCDAIKNSTFSIPTARIGSKTNSVKGYIYDISVK